MGKNFTHWIVWAKDKAVLESSDICNLKTGLETTPATETTEDPKLQKKPSNTPKTFTDKLKIFGKKLGIGKKEKTNGKAIEISAEPEDQTTANTENIADSTATKISISSGDQGKNESDEIKTAKPLTSGDANPVRILSDKTNTDNTGTVGVPEKVAPTETGNINCTPAPANDATKLPTGDIPTTSPDCNNNTNGTDNVADNAQTLETNHENGTQITENGAMTSQTGVTAPVVQETPTKSSDEIITFTDAEHLEPDLKEIMSTAKLRLGNYSDAQTLDMIEGVHPEKTTICSNGMKYEDIKNKISYDGIQVNRKSWICNVGCHESVNYWLFSRYRSDLDFLEILIKHRYN